MIKTLIFLAAIAGAAYGLGLLWDQPGSLTLDWFGYHIETSPLIGLAFVLAAAVVLGMVWSLIRFIFHVPTLMSLARHARRKARGHEALSRGILAAGAGDAQRAQKASLEAKKYLPDEPLTLLLEAQAAQLTGDRPKAERAFRAMIARGDTKMLGLRGLHAESLRQGDADAAHALALEAHSARPLSWSGQAVLDRHTAARDWEAAHLCVDQNLRAKIVDPATARRQKAVLGAAIAGDCELTAPDRAIKLLRAALKKAPDLVPAAVLLGRLLSRKGDMRAASKMIEEIYAKEPHPELARAYVDMRPGDSSSDRLARAKTLAKVAPASPESAMIVAVTAIAARDFAAARQAMAPLVASGERPTARMCVIMAELEDREHDAQGLAREWLARAARAPRDALWFADGHWSRQWDAISPVTGKLDAYRWTEPTEELTGPAEEPPPAYEPPALEVQAEAPAPSPVAIVEPPPAPVEDKPARPSPQPVVFPMASPPDDPGPKKQQADSRLY